MTVAELIAELQRLPQYYPVLCEGPRYDESIRLVGIRNLGHQIGPVAVIWTLTDPRNGVDQDAY